MQWHRQPQIPDVSLEGVCARTGVQRSTGQAHRPGGDGGHACASFYVAAKTRRRLQPLSTLLSHALADVASMLNSARGEGAVQ